MNCWRHIVVISAALLLALPAAVAQRPTRPVTPPAAANSKPEGGLEVVLNRMDNAAAAFRSAQADFTWDQYQTVVDETDTQKGTIYFRRRGKDTEMAADVRDPQPKYVLFSDGKLRLYQPKIDQVTEYSAGKNRADVESFLVLGFGSRGHDLSRSFNVKLLKKETVDGLPTSVLELVPTAPSLRRMFDRILLWIDDARGVSIKQQFFEPSGDYRLARYANIRTNQKIGDDAFKLKTTANTKVINPQGG